MTSYNVQCILYTCYCVLAVLEWHQRRMSSLWVSKDDTASSSAVHHIQGAPVLKVCVMFLLQCITNVMNPVLLECKDVSRRGREGSCYVWGLEQSS
jgi:hypothetical protein